MDKFRTERDSLGEVRVPQDALYGAQTQRAVENFPVSGIRFTRAFIRALGLVKSSAAEVNRDLGILESVRADAVVRAANEVAEGLWDAQFPLDIFQTGSGTSMNMNANEVIACRANQILAGIPGALQVHPNDHVNRGQSSNDVIPSAIHVSAYAETKRLLLPGLVLLRNSLRTRSEEHAGIIKTGRTHMMDAMPLSLGQEMGGWAFQVEEGIERIYPCLGRLANLAIGGTAVGTGINTHPEFGKQVAKRLLERTGHPFVETPNHFAAQSSMDAAVELSSHLKTLATAVLKIANDLRLMNSGPHAGLAEISLPALQPGSSIMPGKTNPVICEAVMMSCVQAIANDTAITLCNGLGNFELNTMLPLIAHNLLQSVTILGNAAGLFAVKAVDGFTLNTARISEGLRKNPVIATALVPLIGYDRTAEIVKKAYAEDRPIRDVAAEMTDLSKEELDRLLDPSSLL